jgi:hypothetical protein
MLKEICERVKGCRKKKELNVNRYVWQYRENKMSKAKKKEKNTGRRKKKGTSIVNRYKAGTEAIKVTEVERSANC